MAVDNNRKMLLEGKRGSMLKKKTDLVKKHGIKVGVDGSFVMADDTEDGGWEFYNEVMNKMEVLSFSPS